MFQGYQDHHQIADCHCLFPVGYFWECTPILLADIFTMAPAFSTEHCQQQEYVEHSEDHIVPSYWSEVVNRELYQDSSNTCSQNRKLRIMRSHITSLVPPHEHPTVTHPTSVTHTHTHTHAHTHTHTYLDTCWYQYVATVTSRSSQCRVHTDVTSCSTTTQYKNTIPLSWGTI